MCISPDNIFLKFEVDDRYRVVRIRFIAVYLWGNMDILLAYVLFAQVGAGERSKWWKT